MNILVDLPLEMQVEILTYVPNLANFSQASKTTLNIVSTTDATFRDKAQARETLRNKKNWSYIKYRVCLALSIFVSPLIMLTVIVTSIFFSCLWVSYSFYKYGLCWKSLKSGCVCGYVWGTHLGKTFGSLGFHPFSLQFAWDYVILKSLEEGLNIQKDYNVTLNKERMQKKFLDSTVKLRGLKDLPYFFIYNLLFSKKYNFYRDLNTPYFSFSSIE